MRYSDKSVPVFPSSRSPCSPHPRVELARRVHCLAAGRWFAAGRCPRRCYGQIGEDIVDLIKTLLSRLTTDVVNSLWQKSINRSRPEVDGVA